MQNIEKRTLGTRWDRKVRKKCAETEGLKNLNDCCSAIDG